MTGGPSVLYAQSVERGLNLKRGDVFGAKFRIDSTIGRGRTGSVYRALELETGTACALKIIHTELSKDTENVQRLESAAQAAMTLRTPHAARVLATGCDGGHLWCQTELGLGVPLSEFMTGQLPTPASMTDLLCQLFAALRAAHTSGLVHGRLNPESIRVAGAPGDLPYLMVLGFGKPELSRVVDPSAPSGALWRAPELRGAPAVALRPSADVWSLGLLAYYVFTGHLYWTPTEADREELPLTPQPASERALRAGSTVPLGFDGWFARCVATNPELRYRAAGAALRGLMSLLDRRDHPRHRLWMPVYCDALSGGVAITHDASDNGMLVLTRSSMEEGEELRVRFSVPPGSGNEFAATARVVRCSENGDDPEGLWKYQMAVAFGAEVTGLQALLACLAQEMEPAPPSTPEERSSTGAGRSQ